jgi:hypothetical protein
MKEKICVCGHKEKKHSLGLMCLYKSWFSFTFCDCRHFIPAQEELVIDTSSFTFGCPVKDCGWYMQNQKDLDDHMKIGKHGIDEEDMKKTTTA